MVLQLQYDAQTLHNTGAAFLRGNTPEEWFREMNEWEIPLKGLSGFLLPEHKNTEEAGGLLVIFNNQLPSPEKIRHPYTVINGNFFIPVNAQITPAISPGEMKDLLIWHRQILHPAIGFVGFETRDEIRLSVLVSTDKQLTRSWNHAHPGMPPTARLTNIGITQVDTTASISDLLGSGEAPKPLYELPEEDGTISSGLPPEEYPEGRTQEPSFFRGGLLFKILAGLLSLFPFGRGTGSSNRSSGSRTGAGAGGADVQKGLEKMMQDIQAKRDRELERLLKLFETNPQEALKYAIPLQDNASGRGAAPPSDRLSANNTNFNLGGLFSNRAVDGWQTSWDQSEQLRKKYREQAEKAIQEGDFRQAAYIYAHLLNDLWQAAKLLERGKFFHEAAILYQGHLNQPLEAARCYEQGGLLLEAIKIYKAQKKFEKTGDLLMQLSRRDSALEYYQLAVQASLNISDYLGAARILQEKVADTTAASDVLLKGWQHDSSAKNCLVKYLEINNLLDKAGLATKIAGIYTEKTPQERHNQLLSILLDFREHMDEPARNMTTQITYEVISPQIEHGDTSKLNLLKRVLPDDKQIPQDIDRYNNRQKYPEVNVKTDQGFRLRDDIEWYGATASMQQLIFVGILSTRVFVLRMTLQGHQKYYSWESQHLAEQIRLKREVTLDPYFPITGNMRHRQLTMFLKTNWGVIDIGAPELPLIPPFQSNIRLDTTDYSATEQLVGVTNDLDSQPVLFIADKQTRELHVQDDNMEGERVLTKCFNEKTNLPVILPLKAMPYQIYGNDPFYLHYSEYVLRVESLGGTAILKMDAEIDNMTIFQHSLNTTIVVSTKKGCLFLREDSQGFRKITENFTTGSHMLPWQLVSENLLVMASAGSGAQVYEFIPGKGGQVVREIKTASPVSFILPTGNAGTVVLVDDRGRITVAETGHRPG
ncbi:hypothetical protein SAMN05428949_5397 [Chitinophaga sp. YR627]|uniref:hypothetical protein n=1 Tax=Chitinophaga sp. YR627 TaxID=1881041 RepID=UPI0008EA045D|nr:hypothetical protein [Chitinophaga sp. YR627]SFO49282.1 hypothetical protein SAMN05428949_5397 [Chitinophaga sp. YR627]